MKKIYDLAGRAPREGGETVLGLKDLGTHACYMIYGIVQAGEPPRIFKPGEGHEEIICVAAGALTLTGPEGQLQLQAGQAVYLTGEETWEAVNQGPMPALYVASGGHGDGGRHQHDHDHDHEHDGRHHHHHHHHHDH